MSRPCNFLCQLTDTGFKEEEKELRCLSGCHPVSVFISFVHFLFQVTTEVGNLLGEEKVDAILCVAGGWAGGSAKSKCESFS